MHPIRLVSHLVYSRLRDGLLGILCHHSLNLEWLLALLLTICNFVLALWYQLCGVMNSRDLGTKVMFLSFEIVWIGDNLAIEVACEAHLNLAGSF